MIKEFDKLLGLVDVNINLQKHKEGVYCRIVFIPLKANPVDLKPREAWGTVDEVENFIRFCLDGFVKNIEHVETGKPIKYVPPVKKVVPKKEKKRDEKKIEIAKVDTKVEPEIQKIIDDTAKAKETIIKATGIPSDNLIVAKVKPIEVLSPDSDKKELIVVIGEPRVLPKAEDIVLDKPNTLVESQPPEVERCSVCNITMERIESSNGDCRYSDCPNGRYKIPPIANTQPVDIIDEHGVNHKELTPEENQLRDAMVKDEVKAITAQEAFSDEVVVDMTNVEKARKENAPKLVFANGKEIEMSESIIEQIDNAPINCEDPEYGHCNSIDNEGENDDPFEQEDEEIKKDQEALEEEPEISEEEQMMIDSQNKALNEAEKRKDDEKEAESTADYMDAQAEAEADNSWSAPTFNF